MARTEPRVVIFTCNWNAHQNLDEAGKRRLNVPPGVRPLKVDCLGQIGASVILKAFEKGADGVMLLGCTPEECHYEFGSRRAAELFEEVRKLAALLGLHEDRLQFYQVGAGEGAEMVRTVKEFVDRLPIQKDESIRWAHASTDEEGAAD
jgi:F420-non-reducing hydrogenase iron-sulfur subunit